MVICAWCESPIRPAGPTKPAATHTHAAASHGICPSCLTARLATITRPVAARPLALR
jgi:hypothetical protein